MPESAETRTLGRSSTEECDHEPVAVCDHRTDLGHHLDCHCPASRRGASDAFGLLSLRPGCRCIAAVAIGRWPAASTRCARSSVLCSAGPMCVLPQLLFLLYRFRLYLQWTDCGGVFHGGTV